MCMKEKEVTTHGGWWGLCLGGNIQSDPGIVVDTIIAMLVCRRAIIGHIVIAHVNVPQVWWLTLGSNVFDG